MDAEQIALTIKNAIRELPTKYETNANKIRQLEEEIDDIKHYMELVNLNVYEGFLAYKDMQKVQQERRKLKDENEELKHLYPAIKALKDRSKQFDSALHGIRKSKRYLRKRKYNCKRRKDLENRINGVKS